MMTRSEILNDINDTLGAWVTSPQKAVDLSQIIFLSAQI